MTIAKNALMRFKLYTQVKRSEKMYRLIVSRALPDLLMTKSLVSVHFVISSVFLNFHIGSSTLTLFIHEER